MIKLLLTGLLSISSLSAFNTQLTIERDNVYDSNIAVKSGLVNVQWKLFSHQGLGETQIEIERSCTDNTQNSSFLIHLGSGQEQRGSQLITLCDGNSIQNKIRFTAKSQSTGLEIRSNDLTITSDTIAPSAPFFEKSGVLLSKDYLLFSGDILNEYNGSLELFYTTKDNKKILVGGASILPNSSFHLIVPSKNIPNDLVSLYAVAYDKAGNSSNSQFVTTISKSSSTQSTLFKELYK